MAISESLTSTLRAELAKLEEERARIDEMIRHLRSTIEASGESAVKTVRRSAKRATSSKPTQPARKRGKTQERAYKAIVKQPGITAGELTTKLKLGQPTSVYPVLRKLQERGDIKKKDKGYEAA